MLPALRPESIRESEKVFLVDCARYLDDGLLHNLDSTAHDPVLAGPLCQIHGLISAIDGIRAGFVGR